jgi:hypothetical protein
VSDPVSSIVKDIKPTLNQHVALVILAVFWQNCPALKQLTIAILGFFAPAACV